MRVGFNPNKDKKLLNSDFFHQVIIPVYIPNQNEYFKDSLAILKLCLESLIKTCHSKTYITVVNNGSCDDVINYLNELYAEKKIHELVNTSNIGYINAMLKGITGHNFTFFTTADADVLFLNNWQQESYNLFEVFSKAGAVSPSPTSWVLKYFTSNVLLEKGFTSAVKFTENIASEGMKAFAKSVDKENFFNDVNFKKCLTVTKNETRGVIGAGHFVVTYRSDVFDTLEKRFTEYALGGDSDFIFDIPVVKRGYWRLATEKNYAFHMGNVKEDWMDEVFSELRNNNHNISKPELKKIKINKLDVWIKTEFFSKIIFRKPFWKIFIRFKGLSKIEANQYK